MKIEAALHQKAKGSDTMAPATQVIKNTEEEHSAEVIKTTYSEKSAIGALYDELSKGIESLKKGDVYSIDEAWEEIDKI